MKGEDKLVRAGEGTGYGGHKDPGHSFAPSCSDWVVSEPRTEEVAENIAKLRAQTSEAYITFAVVVVSGATVTGAVSLASVLGHSITRTARSQRFQRGILPAPKRCFAQ